MLDFIFHYLMEDIHIRDFYRLSSPDECKRYILVLANRIHESFLSLDIVPSRTRAGKLYYRSVHDHVSPPTEAEKVERQTLCVVLAFFYVRIFQIFGALALTLVDDATAMPRVARGVARVFEAGAGAGARPAIGRIGEMPVPFRGRPGARLVGGARPNLGAFSFIPLRFYETIPGPDRRNYFQIDTMTYGVGIQEIAQTFAPSPSAQLLFYLKTPVTISGRNIKYAILTMKITQKGDNVFQLAFENEMTLPGVVLSRLGDFNKQMGVATIKKESLGTYDASLDGIHYTGKDIGQMFDVFGEKLETFLRARRDKREEDYGEYRGDRRPTIGFDLGGELPRRPGAPTPLLADDKVPQGMRMSSLYHALTVTRPLPSCVSRAIQLLTTMPSGGMGPALTSICDKGFLVEDGNKLRAGVPRPDDSMETSPGEMALVQLFYDTVSKATRDSLEQSPGALKDYTTFMKAMATVYGSFPAEKMPADFSAVRPIEIKDKYMKSLCESMSATGTLEISDSVARTVIPYVQQLFRQQLAHAAAAGKILSMLFSIETKGGTRQIRLNPKLLDGGFPALEVITAETRRLLSAYYAKCEETYRAGVERMAAGAKAEARALAPAAGAGAGAVAMPVAAPTKPPLAVGQKTLVELKKMGPGVDTEVTKRTMEGILRRAAPTIPVAPPGPLKRPEEIAKRVVFDEKKGGR